jgi:hypothetical protein
MVLDGGAKILKVTPRSSSIAAPASIGAASLAVDVGQFQSAPELVEARNAASQLIATGLPINGIIVVDGQNVSDFDQLDVPLLPRRPVLVGDVLGKLTLCRFNFMRKASCGDMAALVEDDPRGAPDKFALPPLLRSEP